MTRTLGKAVTPAVNEPSHLERLVFHGAARSDISYVAPDMALAHGEAHIRDKRPVVPMHPPVARVVPDPVAHRPDQYVCPRGLVFNSLVEAVASCKPECRGSCR